MDEPKVCGTCRHFDRIDANQGACVAHPPHATILIVQQMNLAMAQPAMVPQNFTAFPILADKQFCHEWAAHSVLQLASH